MCLCVCAAAAIPSREHLIGHDSHQGFDSSAGLVNQPAEHIDRYIDKQKCTFIDSIDHIVA